MEGISGAMEHADTFIGSTMRGVRKMLRTLGRKRPRNPGVGDHIVLTVHVEQDEETGLFEAECVELQVPSFGPTLHEALESVEDAILVYLDTLTESGDIGSVLHERGVNIRREKEEAETVKVNARFGELVSALSVPIRDLAVG